MQFANCTVLGVPVIFRSDCDFRVPITTGDIENSECQSFLGQTATVGTFIIMWVVSLGVPVIFRSDCDFRTPERYRSQVLGVPVIFRSDCDIVLPRHRG